jgi:hypothetical protein
MSTFFTCCRKTFVFLLGLVFLAACASKSKNIDSTYVSPLAYQSYNCEQIGREMSRVGLNLSEVSGTQDSTSTKDTVAMTVGLVVFWPSLFFLAAGEDQKGEIARLKGESDALEQSAISKQCTTVLAQRDEALRLYEKQQQEKKEKEALVESKFEDCMELSGGNRESDCDKEAIAAEIDKEQIESVANLSEDENPPSEEDPPQIEAVALSSKTKPEDNLSGSEFYKTKCMKCGDVVSYQAKYSGTLAKCMQCDTPYTLP